MPSKDGINVIAIKGILFLIFLILALLFSHIILYITVFVTGIFFLFSFFFFRDPERTVPTGEQSVISPADGRVIKVTEVNDPIYFKENVRMISIFMSVFNVHVNRIPISGKVDYLDYKKGAYLAAFRDRACEHNEQSIIGISGKAGKILFKQIAGLIARRIVYRVKVGDEVKAGDRFGIIKYGSRLDVFLPLSAKVEVTEGDKVKAGVSILGEL